MPPPVEFKTAGTEGIHTDMNAIENGSIADETCDALCRAAREKSLELGIDISFAVADADGLPRMFRRFGDALVLSATLVPAKAHTAAVARLSTGELAKCAAEGNSTPRRGFCSPPSSNSARTPQIRWARGKSRGAPKSTFPP